MQIETAGVELGDTARDKITGFEGTVIGVTQWTTGCARATLQPRVDKDGKVPDAVGFDVTTLQVLMTGPNHVADRTTGGPRPEPAPRFVTPTRR